MILFLGAAGLLVLPLGVYLYFLVGRFLGVLLGDRRKRLQKGLSAATAVAAAGLSVNLFSLWALLVFYFAAVSGVIDLLRLLWKKAGGGWSRTMDLLYRSGAVAAVIVAVIMGYAYWNMHRIVVTDYTVETEKTIQAEEIRIVFVSDLHFDTTMDEEKLKDCCMRMEQEQPDLVVLGGDIVDETTLLREAEQAFRALAQIDSTFGTFYVYGNHDKGTYSKACDFTQEELEQAIRDSGVRILEDETVILNDKLTITGRRDRSGAVVGQTPRKNPQELFADLQQSGASSEAFHILADHQPREMEENAAAGFDLMLSGHTHAGQMWPVGLVTELFDKKTVNYGQKSFGNMELVVSSGIAGWGYPLRTGKHSEYTVITVR